MLTTQRLQQLFSYNPETGELVRLVKTGRSTKIGEVAGSMQPDGRHLISVDGKRYKTHHAVWVWHGNDQPDRIDHKDRNPSNNRIENLRLCSNAENAWNANRSKANTSGVRGVFWNKANHKWRARIMVNGKIVELGCHEDLEFAELVAAEARAKYHGSFANAF